MDYEEFFTDLHKNDIQEVLEGELDYVHMCKTTGENQYICLLYTSPSPRD